MEIINDGIKAQNVAFEEFIDKNDERFEHVEKALKIANRPFCAGGSSEDDNHAKAFFEYVQKGGSDAELKAFNTITNADGGYAVPTQLDDNLNLSVQNVSAIRKLSKVIKIDSGNYAKVVNLGGTASGWVGEQAARPETASPDLAKLTPYMGEIYANPAATQTLLDDTNNIEAWLTSEIEAEMSSKEAAALIGGTGVNQPKGILTYDSEETADATRDFGTIEHLEAASATAIAGDELIDLVYSLNGFYRAGNETAFIMNSTTASLLRKLKSGDDYVWDSNFQNSQPEKLLGYQVEIDENMPDATAGLIPIIFGNLSKGVTIVDRTSGMLRDPYTNKPYVQFYCTKRVGNLVHDSSAFKFLKMAAS